MSEVEDSADCGLCTNSHGMGVSMHDSVVLALFGAWFFVVMLVMSGSPAWAAGFAVPLAGVTTLLIARARRSVVTSA